MKTINFKDRIPGLSEEHIKQICIFTKTEYVQGEWQKWRAYAEFKKWHHQQLKLREIAELKKSIREIVRRSKKYPPVQSIVNEQVGMVRRLKELESGGNTK